MKRVAAVLGLGASLSFALASFALGSCGGGAHVLEGQRFDPSRGCLEKTSTLDVLDGPPPAQPCAPLCLLQTTSDGGTALYVSRSCPPFPPQWDTSAKDPRCALALAAASRNDSCLSDGGSTHPPVDASPEASPPDAGPDAPSDAPADAPNDAPTDGPDDSR